MTFTLKKSNNKGTDQTAQTRSLICALLFACSKMRFLGARLSFCTHSSNCSVVKCLIAYNLQLHISNT